MGEIPRMLGILLLTFTLSVVLTRLIIYFSFKHNLMAKPTDDRWHTTPTPIFGGIAIFISFFVIFMVFSRSILTDVRMIGLLIGAVVMFATGLIDDTKNLRPYAKLLLQIFAAIIVLGAGVYFRMFSPLICIPLSVLWIIGITNAFNLLDNMDGLSAGIASIVCLNVVLYDLVAGPGHIFMPALILMGAMLGFLVYNFNPAKIFMGDSGSLFIGFTVASLTVIGSNKDVSNLALSILFPLLMMSVPIFDTTLVTVMRNLTGRKVSEGGKDHSSHRLVALGLSERNTVLLLYIISLLSGGLVIAYKLMSWPALVVIALILWLLLYYFGIFLSQAKVYTKDRASIRERVSSLPRRFLQTALLNRLPSTEVLIDFLLIGLSLTIGYLLRFDGKISEHDTRLMIYSFAILVPIKLACLHYFGVYKQMWRYINFRDLVNIFQAASLGSLISIFMILLFQRFQGFSRTIYIIDWFVFLLLVVMSRLVIRILRDSFLRIKPHGSEMVIYGAGDAGNMLLEEIFNSDNFSFQPVAFFDDNQSKHGRMIQGIQIIGGIDKLEDYIKKYQVQKLVIAIPSQTDESLGHIFEHGKRLGLEIMRFVPARMFSVADWSEAPEAEQQDAVKVTID